MAFFTRSDLQSRPVFESKASAERLHQKSASARHHVFLSHSHRDSDLVLHVAALIGRYALAIYVDWKDNSMPEVTIPETARRIKSKITETGKFILVETNNALASKWVPWELGIADKANGMANVVVFPIIDPPHVWNGNEYIGIYSYVDRANSQDGSIVNEPAVRNPETGTAVWLKDWLVS